MQLQEPVQGLMMTNAASVGGNLCQKQFSDSWQVERRVWYKECSETLCQSHYKK